MRYHAAVILRWLVSTWLVIALVASGPGEWVLVACAMGGEIMDDCCCDHVESLTSASACKDNCCDVQVVKATPFSVDEVIAPTSIAVAIGTAHDSPPLFRQPKAVDVHCAAARAPPRPPDTPIYIEVCSLLI